MNDPARELDRTYARSLADHLAGGGEEALRRAYEVGRSALAGGRSLLDLAAVHHAALAEELLRRGSPSTAQDLSRASEVLCECLSSYEMAQRGFQEAVHGLRGLNDTLEGEIQRIAHAVHDEAGQLLVAARLAMSGAAQEAGPALRERLRVVGTILDEADGTLRRLSRELRPTLLDDLGLVPALEALAARISGGSGLRVEVESSLEERQAPRIETALYRVAQEALSNAARHSAARKVSILLTREARSLHCTVRDDGTGFDVEATLAGRKGLGLLGIRERLNAVGGNLRIDSQRGRGTEVHVFIPVGS